MDGKNTTVRSDSPHLPDSTEKQQDTNFIRRLEIGCGKSKRDGWEGLDRVRFEEVDYVWDITDIPWPFKDNTFDESRASQVLEHIGFEEGKDLICVVNEIHRIMKPGGVFEIVVPSWHSDCAVLHPDHKRFFAKDSFSFWMEPAGDEDPHEMYPRGFWSMVNIIEDDANITVRMKAVKNDRTYTRRK